MFEKLVHGTLHCQLVQVSIQERYDALWKRRRAVQVHYSGVL